MKFLQLSSIAFVSFSLTYFNDIQALFSLNSLSENPKLLIHLSPVLAQTSTDKKAKTDRLLKQGIWVRTIWNLTQSVSLLILEINESCYKI